MGTRSKEGKKTDQEEKELTFPQKKGTKASVSVQRKKRRRVEKSS